MKRIRAIQAAAAAITLVTLFARSAESQTVYAETAFGNFGKLNIATGVFTALAPNPTQPYALTFGNDGTLYSAEGHLATYNLTTGAATVGASTGSANLGIAAVPNSNNLYAESQSAGLSTIDLTTGAVTYIGANGLSFRADGWFGDTFTSNGVLYSSFINDSNYDQGLYSINTSTGAATLVHDFGIGHLLNGFITFGSNMYGFDYINRAFNNQINEIYDYTGGVLVDTHVAVTGLANPNDSILATAFMPDAEPTPEPGVMAMIASCGLAGIVIRRRRG